MEVIDETDADENRDVLMRFASETKVIAHRDLLRTASRVRIDSMDLLIWFRPMTLYRKSLVQAMALLGT